MMIPDRHAERARRVRGDRSRDDERPAAGARDPRASRVDRRSSSARPTRPPARRWRCRRWRATCCCDEARRRAAYHLCVRDAGDDRPRRGGAAAIAAHARRGHRARLAAAAPRRGLVRVEPRAAHRARRGGREPRPHGPGARRRRLNMFTGGAIDVLLYALAERGEFEEARELLRRHRLDGALGPTRWEIGMRHARARLWLAEGDFERAHAEACEAGALREQQGRHNPTLDAVALDRRPGARPPRAPRRGRRAGRRRAGAGRALRRAGADRPRAARARRRGGRRRRARGALRARAGRDRGRARAAAARAPAPGAGQHAGLHGPAHRGPRRAAPRAGRRRRRRRRAAGRSARAASSWPPGCARARPRSRVPRR